MSERLISTVLELAGEDAGQGQSDPAIKHWFRLQRPSIKRYQPLFL